MRILFSFVGGSGHFGPLAPIARAAVAAGHTVAVTCESTMVPVIEAAGFTAFVSGPDLGGSARHPLLELDMEREERAITDGFAGRHAKQRATDVLALCGDWKPDLLVCDEVDFGAVVAAERFGIPHATVLVIAAGVLTRRELVAEPLAALRAEHGLPPDPSLRMLSRHLVLSPFPASFRDPAYPLPETAVSLRDLGLTSASGTAPDWLRAGSTVYFTLGTIFNMESGDLFNRVLDGLRDLPVNLIVTTGRHIDPAEFGPQPSNVHIERFIPQADVLPHCDAVVSHGGSGSVMGALAHGLPMVLLPMGADQPHNADRCVALGAGRVLDPITATPDDVSEAVATLLADESYRHAAKRVRTEIEALPGEDHALELLEGLVRA